MHKLPFNSFVDVSACHTVREMYRQDSTVKVLLSGAEQARPVVRPAHRVILMFFSSLLRDPATCGELYLPPPSLLVTSRNRQSRFERRNQWTEEPAQGRGQIVNRKNAALECA